MEPYRHHSAEPNVLYDYAAHASKRSRRYRLLELAAIVPLGIWLACYVLNVQSVVGGISFVVGAGLLRFVSWGRLNHPENTYLDLDDDA